MPGEKCGWCGVDLRPGTLPVSHGICDPCKAKFQAEADEEAARWNRVMRSE